MDQTSFLSHLIAASPYLAGGYALNVAISIGAMLLGTLIGVPIGLMRSGPARLIAEGATQVTRNVPSFVLLFFLAAVLPEQVIIGDVITWPLGGSMTAVLALAIPVAGFVSDATHSLKQEPPAERRGRLATLSLAYVQYLVVILMASATASVIGVDELVARSNNLVSQEVDVAAMLGVYLYAASWFMLTGAVLLAAGKWLAARIGREGGGQTPPAAAARHSG